MSGDIFQMDLL